MSIPVRLDTNYLAPDVTPDEISAWQPYVDQAHAMLIHGAGRGADFLGWLEPAALMPADLRNRLKATAARLREKADVMVVIGIGGSYLGARAVIEALAGADAGRVVYAGQTLSADYLASLLRSLDGKRWCINVISKSGTTTEPSVAFRVLREALEKQVGADAAKDLIVATTDPDETKSALRRVAKAMGYETYEVPPNVGGRYSVLSAVGILPIAFAGVDVDALVEGATACAEASNTTDVMRNPAYHYAVVRNLLYQKGKVIELLAVWEPRLVMMAEWWKQLFGESEGKDHMSLFPASVQNTTDLHSMGQWVQQGRRNLLETFLHIEDAGGGDLPIPNDPENSDGLNFLTGTQMAEVNRKAFEGTALAHRDGGVPNQTLILPALDARSLGTLIYFFERAAVVSGYLLGINPFDQPGVEAYKTNMFALMKKPGFEEKSAEVEQRVKDARKQEPIGFEK